MHINSFFANHLFSLIGINYWIKCEVYKANSNRISGTNHFFSDPQENLKKLSHFLSLFHIWHIHFFRFFTNNPSSFVLFLGKSFICRCWLGTVESHWSSNPLKSHCPSLLQEITVGDFHRCELFGARQLIARACLRLAANLFWSFDARIQQTRPLPPLKVGNQTC